VLSLLSLWLHKDRQRKVASQHSSTVLAEEKRLTNHSAKNPVFRQDKIG